MQANLGQETDGNFRLWYTDHALHGDSAEQVDPTRTVSYLGALQQALPNLSQWIEKGVTPPASTAYRIDDGQMLRAGSPQDPARRDGRRQWRTQGQADAQWSHAFPKPGVYFPALRVVSERNGDAASPYARIQNLGRVRVVVQ